MTDTPGPRPTFRIGTTEIPARPVEPGLYLVATPIGNLGDITLRALETLAAADLLACEDTRVTRNLLSRYDIRQRPLAYHEHNAAEAGPRLMAALTEGRSVALVSDAGTPLISDPGYRLVEQALEAGIRVHPLPGPSAPLAALVASGLPTDTFLFGGFLPQKRNARLARLASLKAVDATLIFFESPHRLAESLADVAETFPGRIVVVARELTKAFEEIRRGATEAIASHYAQAGAPKGEIVLCIAPPSGETVHDEHDVDRLLLSLAGEMPASKAAAEAARMTGQPKGDLYRRLLDLRPRDGDG